MSVRERSDLATAAGIAAALVTLTAVVALAVALTAAAPARDLLGFGFAGTPARIGEAARIFAGNARLLIALLVAALVVRAADGRVVPRLCDLGVAGAAVANAVLVGAALGAYGDRMALALLPHGPIELAAFATGLAVYLAARRGPVDARRFARLSVLALAGLAVAAPAEVFLAP